MPHQLTNKRIVLGVTGSIAAYKAAELVRRLRGAGADVRVIMTRAAKGFVGPLTFQALSGYPVLDDWLTSDGSDCDRTGLSHIEWARWADVVLIAPASADCLARLTQGRANDPLMAVCQATSSPVAAAPAMNRQMWQNEATRENVQMLRQRGIRILGPGHGQQACGESGEGRMLELAELVEAVAGLFEVGLLSGCRVVITAGPTRERIDPIRFLSNRSSGRMGYAIAAAAAEAGAQVTLISGPVHLETPDRVKRIDVVSGREMCDAALAEADQCDMVIGVAAVSDYHCAEILEKKLKKTQEKMTLSLERNPDILREIGQLQKRPFLVGFAAETENLIVNARCKLAEKNLDMIVANHVDDTSAFESEYNEVNVVWRGGQQAYPRATKTQLARSLIALIAAHYRLVCT